VCGLDAYGICMFSVSAHGRNLIGSSRMVIGFFLQSRPRVSIQLVNVVPEEARGLSVAKRYELSCITARLESGSLRMLNNEGGTSKNTKDSVEDQMPVFGRPK
jgi:hypothetical protein